MWVGGCPGGRRASGTFSAVICITDLKTNKNKSNMSVLL